MVHEWLSGYAGSERVLEQILALYPNADLFSVVDFVDGDRSFLRGRSPNTTFIQRLPFARKHFRAYLPLMPLAIEGLDLSRYDVVISSSHAVAKGVLTRPGQTHVCYCHTPLRYAWDLQHDYLSGSRGIRRAATRALLHYLRLWDSRTAHGVDHFVANSRYVAQRIRKTYGRDAEIIYPPVDTEWFRPGSGPRENFFFTSSRFVRYKHHDVIVEAFSRTPERSLIVAGDGPERARVQAGAGRNVHFVGQVSNGELREYMQRARAFVFAAEEDFGIVVAEAQACGAPVICYGRGGATEIVRDGRTGVLFPEKTSESLLGALAEFESRAAQFDPALISRSAQRFSTMSFRTRFSSLVDAVSGSAEVRRLAEAVPAWTTLMATSPAHLRTSPVPLPVLVPAEPIRVAPFTPAVPWRMRAILIGADLMALCGTALLVSVNLSVFLLPLAFAAAGLYSVVPKHPAEELRRVSATTLLAFAFAGPGSMLTAPLALLIVLAARRAVRAALFGASWWGTDVAVLAPDTADAEEVVEMLRSRPHLGLKPAALLHGGSTGRERGRNIAIRGPLEFSSVLARDHNVRCAVVAAGDAAGETWDALYRAAAPFEHVIFLQPDGFEATLHGEALDLAGMSAIAARHNLLRPGIRRIKGGLERSIALVAAAPAAIAGVLIALLIKATSRGPVLYSHQRVGRHGRPFAMLKFRTMVADADAVLESALRNNPALRREWMAHRKLQNDPRVTRLGALLRRTSLDELPQLINVLRGDMSLVGPRPVVEAELRRYGRDADVYRKVRPGITGLWQVSGRNDVSYEQRVQLDGWYVRNWSVWLDLDILLRTTWVVLRGRGAY